ncbi:MAG TPA: chemotaxis protein CheW [Thermoanaerobaculia bacterium]|nr:chemotaxis protein CheW [Thermoanaerobaculia bacterium]
MTHNPYEELAADFLLDAGERLNRLEEVLLAAASAGGADVSPWLEESRLQLHTLKGNSGMMGFARLQEIAHDLEDRIEELDPRRPQVDGMLAGVDLFRRELGRIEGVPEEGESVLERGAAPSDLTREGVRVPFQTLDGLVDLLGEMVILRNRLADSLTRCRESGGVPGSDEWAGVGESHELLGKTLDQLRDGVLRLRMVPLKTLFGPLARIAHDESAREGKEVRFETAGGETPLDKALLELSSEALGHLVRNAVIHGLEDTEERRRAGKPARGFVRLSAETDAREVRIDVLDDGGGIRRAEVVAAAERQGHRLAPGEDPLSLLFLPGFSTREGADLSSGRGIGLAAVQKAVNRRGGRIEVFSEEGAGTLFRLRLPLSVSITRALLLASDGEDYALPLSAVVESVPLTAPRVHEVNGASLLDWRGGLIPLLDLGTSFGTALTRRRSGFAVVIEAAGAHRALAADRLHGIREVVVKGLDRLAGDPPGIAGATVLGDGRAVLILDPTGLMELSPFAGAAGGAA